jgi:hypothetical protein
MSYEVTFKAYYTRFVHGKLFEKVRDYMVEIGATGMSDHVRETRVFNRVGDSATLEIGNGSWEFELEAIGLPEFNDSHRDDTEFLLERICSTTATGILFDVTEVEDDD